MSVRTFSLDDKTSIFAFRAVTCLTLAVLLIHSPRLEQTFQQSPFVIAAFYLMTSFFLWSSSSPQLQSVQVQTLTYLWDIGVISCLMYYSEGFDDELYLMYFLILFMSGLLSQVKQGFLTGTVSSLIYAGLWSHGDVARGLPLTNLLLRFAFFYVVSFFTAVMVERVRARDRRLKNLELRLALGKIANGGWGIAVEEGLSPNIDPELLKTIRTVNAVIDNMTRVLQKTINKNEELHQVACAALLQLAHVKEQLGATPVKEKKESVPNPTKKPILL